MYNLDIKREFISYKEEVTVLKDKFLEKIFEKTEPYEIEFNKDVSSFSITNIINMYKLWNISSFNTLNLTNSMLVSYTEFCIKKGYVKDCQNYFSMVTQDDIQGCLNKVLQKMQIITREELLNTINNFRPRDKYTILAMFEFGRGKDYEDIYKLHLEDVDVKNRKATLVSGRTVDLSKELVNTIVESAQTYEFETQNRIMPLTDSGEKIDILKIYCGRPVTRRSVYNSIKNSLSYFNKAVTTDSIVNSGRIDFVQRGMKETGLSAKDYIIQHNNEIANQYGVKIAPALFVRKFRDYL